MNEAAYLVEMRRYDVISHEGLISKEKASKGYKPPQEAFISGSSANPLSWLSPRG